MVLASTCYPLSKLHLPHYEIGHESLFLKDVLDDQPNGEKRKCFILLNPLFSRWHAHIHLSFLRSWCFLEVFGIGIRCPKPHAVRSHRAIPSHACGIWSVKQLFPLFCPSALSLCSLPLLSLFLALVYMILLNRFISWLKASVFVKENVERSHSSWPNPGTSWSSGATWRGSFSFSNFGGPLLVLFSLTNSFLDDSSGRVSTLSESGVV